MSLRSLVWMLLVAGLIATAVFVWPTRYRAVELPADLGPGQNPMRADRITGELQTQNADGEWSTYNRPPEFRVEDDSPTGRAVGKAQQAGKEIKQMNDAASEAMKR